MVTAPGTITMMLNHVGMSLRELVTYVHNQEENHEGLLLSSNLSQCVQPQRIDPRKRATIGE